MIMDRSPIPVDFPLRGEWVAHHTPAARVPSHGTDAYGQRYAYDFYRVDRTAGTWKTCRSSAIRYYMDGLPLDDFYAWGEPVYAPFAGRVVVARDEWPERTPVQYLEVRIRPALDGLLSLLAGRPWDAGIAGNHVILEHRGASVYAFFAHLKSGSVAVRAGDEVELGGRLGAVGQSGRSSEPHLHFHLMDRSDLDGAHGLPCSFKAYEELQGTTWQPVRNGIPGRMQPIRSAV